MFKKDKPKLDTSEDQLDPEITKFMGLPPEEAAPKLSADMETPPADEQQKINQILGPSDVKQAATETNINSNQEFDSTTNKAPEDLVKSGQEDDDKLLKVDEPIDSKTDQAVKDIIAKEGDELLEARDDNSDNFAVTPSRPKGIKGIILAWWHNRLLRNISIFGLTAILLILVILPTTRYAVLNTIGVKASTSLSVIDAKSERPLKNVDVLIAGVSAKTDSQGNVTIRGLKLGKTELSLKKRSFAPVSQTVVVGWGSNPYAYPFQLKPVGSAYKFEIVDWLSKKPIDKAEVTDGDSVAIATEDGQATLTIEPKGDVLNLKIKADGYREDTLQIEASDKTDKPIKLVPSRPDIFVSRRSGKYDLYKRDADGKNEAVLFAGTGSEQEDISILVHPETNYAAFVSSREGKRNKQGFLLSNLYIVDIDKKIVSKVESTESEKIQLIDWIGDKLIYVKIIAGPSASTVGRQRVIAYDYIQDKQSELASTNYFNDVEVFNKQVYYAPSSGGLVSAASQLFKINPDGSSKTSLVNKETWVVYRNSYDKLQASAINNSWYEININDAKVTAMPGAPASPAHRVYIDSPNSEYSLWVDNRDGKGVLIAQNLKSNTENVLHSRGGLSYPIRWLNNKNILFRVTNSQETADYVLNIDGGEIVKVSDVTATSSTNRWYYYR